jgi:ribose transport system ATP-binding protein
MRGVSKGFVAVQALDGVDLEVHSGEVHALVGENGAGKSTLMKVLSGAHLPDAGSLELGGKLFRPSGPLDARRAGVAMIYQEQSLATHLSGEDNVMLGRERCRSGPLGRLDRDAQRRAVRDALASLGHPEIQTHRRVAELGPGARQVVEIARALIRHPDLEEVRVVVFDEPTSSLSRADVDRLFAALEALRARGVAVVYISHFLEELKRIADRFTVLRDGRVVARGLVADTEVTELVNAMAGRESGVYFQRSAHVPGDEVLRVSELAGQRLPLEASFVLRRGEILGIAGLVGAGRTELMRALFGLDPVQRGEIVLKGDAFRRNTPRASLARGLGLLSEDRNREGLALGLPLAENLTLSRLEPYLRFAGRIDKARQEEACRAWVQRLAIRCPGVRVLVGDLSGGNQQKVALARLLHHDVDVLLLDEPTRGIDVAAKAEIYRLLDRLCTAGKALLVVSSYVPELLGICDRIAVMHRGRLGPARPVGAWSEESILEEATRGT